MTITPVPTSPGAAPTSPAPSSSRRARRDLWPLLLLLAVTLLLFGRVVTFDFVKWDDDVNVYANPHLNPPTWAGMKHYATHLYYNVYMPVTWAVWLLAAAAAYLPNAPPGTPPLNPYVFHVLSLGTHLVGVMLVYGILRQVHFDRWPACGGALVFAVHPLQIEPVAWISAYNVPLCGVLSLAAMWQYLRSADAPDRRRRRRGYLLATLIFILALLAKPLAVTVPLIVMTLDLLLLRRPWRQVVRAMGPWLVLGMSFALLTALWQEKRELGDVLPLWTRPIIAADAISFYLRKLFWPFGMTLDHGRTPLVALSDPNLLLSVLLPLVLLAVLWIGRDRVRPLWAGAVMAIAALLPVLGLAPFDFQQFSTVADRYAYLAMLGTAVGVAWLISLAAARARVVLSLALAALLTAAAWPQVGAWRNSHALFARSTTINPRSAVSWLNWGAVLMAERRPHEAAERFRRAIELVHDYHAARLNLGSALHDAGDMAGALRERQRLVALFSDSPMAYVALGDVQAELGHHAAARAAYEKALALVPDHPQIRQRLADLDLPGTTTAAPGATTAPADVPNPAADRSYRP